jgi:hypothetical protein
LLAATGGMTLNGFGLGQRIVRHLLQIVSGDRSAATFPAA